MCVAIPGLVVAGGGDGELFAEDDLLGTRRRVGVMLLETPAAPGDWLLVHAGSAVGRVDAAEAREILALLEACAGEPLSN